MRIGLSIIFLLLIPILVNSQTRQPISFSWASNQTTKPFSQMDDLVEAPVHHSFTLGTVFRLNQDSVHQLLQTAKLGYLYHRNSQKAMQLFSEFTYRYRLHKHWKGIGQIGLGYMHAFPDMPTFTLNNGQYEQQSNTGRPQLMITSSLGVQYSIFHEGKESLRVRVYYQPWFQYPFVNEFVPLLPYTALRVGIEKPIQWGQ